LAEPRAPEPPKRVWRDWALLAVLLSAAILEDILRTDITWRPVALVLAVAVVISLLWRRTHPLATVAFAFGVTIVSTVAGQLAGVPSVGLYTMAAVVLLPYSLVRWGSGREIGIGLGIILIAGILGTAAEFTGIGDAIIGMVFLLCPVPIGAAVRYWATSRSRELDQVRLREREQLARELHDTVAHHVSAIAIRAQAGRVVAASHPEAAMDALAVIEAEASQTLAEMRLMVGNLREDDTVALAPQQGVADLERLARSVGDRPRVELNLSGDLADLGPSVGAAIYRIAQESITNAVRHARHATVIDVRVVGDDPEVVRLIICDDGEGSAVRSPRSFEAGPRPDRGWIVQAVLPRTGTAR
jgi:signal transduction histidine kinase